MTAATALRQGSHAPSCLHPAARSVDPLSLATWVQYVSKCSPAAANDSVAPAAECTQLSSALCSRPDVACSKDVTEFKDSSKKVVLRGDNTRGLAFLQ